MAIRNIPIVLIGLNAFNFITVPLTLDYWIGIGDRLGKLSNALTDSISKTIVF